MEIGWWKTFPCSRKAVLFIVGLVLSCSLSSGEARDQEHRQHGSHHHHHEKDVHLTPSHGALGLVSREDDIPPGKHAQAGIEKTLEQSISVSEKENVPPQNEACRHAHCPPGRICSADLANGLGASCRCPDERHCQRQHRKWKVCGSDGRFYDNHCELHRQACLKDVQIRAVRDERVCQRQPANDDGKSPPRPDEHHPPSSSSNSHSSVTKDHPHAVEDKSTAKRGHTRVKPASSQRRDNFHLSVKKDLAMKHVDSSRIANLQEEKGKHMEHSGRNREWKTGNVEENWSACTKEGVEKIVTGMMRRQCIRMGNEDCDNGTEWRQSAASDLFTDIDFNSDVSLELLELNTFEQLAGDDIRLLSRVCRLQDLITFYDVNQDALLSLSEFYSALGLLEEGVQVSKTIVVAGTSLELKCEILDRTRIIWKRNGRTLGDIYNNEIKVLDDGSLYIHDVTLSHIGNYSCVDHISRDVIRSHMVQVQVLPIVRVSPLTQFHSSGSTSTLRCHSEGVPCPELSWDFNESPIPNQPDHYLLLHHNHTLLIKNSQYLRDTGAFKCKAHNTVGTSQDIATVFIENSDVPKYGRVQDPYELFLVFHDNGYSVHEPSHCHIQHIVTGTFDAFKFHPDFAMHDLVQSLCELNRTCSWGDAVNVRNKFIYVSQPVLNRIVVIEVHDRFNPVEIIPMEQKPVQLDYIDHLDEVLVVCWNEGQRDSASKTSLIIRQASSVIQHNTIHMQPLRNSFMPFSAMFLPPNSALNHHFRYGFVVDSTATTTYKVDLVTMKVAHKVNLACNPVSMAFIALGGKVVINCGSQSSAVLILDYLTDEVFEMPNVTGDPYVSPDSRFLVMVDNTRQKISVYRVTNEGAVEHSLDLNPELVVSDVAFLASDSGYDFFASSSDKNSILYIDLTTGLVETIEGVGEATHGEEWLWSRVKRVIVAGGVFSEFLMSPSSEAVVVLDARRRHLQCEWQEVTSHANVIVWTEVSKL